MYLRVSTGSQSVETQNDATLRAASARGDRIERVYAEITGGAARRRPELDRLRAAARAGEISRLWVYRLDRLSRGGIRATLSILEELEACGVEVVTVADGFALSGPARDVVVAVMAWAAEMEREAIAERIRSARARMAARGLPWGRPTRELDISQAKELRTAGRSIRQISMALHVPKSVIGRALKSVPKTPAKSQAQIEPKKRK